MSEHRKVSESASAQGLSVIHFQSGLFESSPTDFICEFLGDAVHWNIFASVNVDIAGDIATLTELKKLVKVR